MASLSKAAREVLEGLLSGRSLDELAPAGSDVRTEVEHHLIATLDSTARKGVRPARKRRPEATRESVEMPGDGWAVVYSDGASRGNPGPAAIGVHLLAPDGTDLATEGAVIGRCTNNVAEYRGLLRALELAQHHGVERLEVRMDSELVVKQLRGEYRVKQPDLAELKEQVDGLKGAFRRIRFRHVRREANRVTDRLANEALDAG
ncbi:MAG TPA: ribonuclease HI family protein [bacterium]|nr:ribonuclease HI family protein [bacterium]